MCVLREPLGDLAELKCMQHCLLSLLFQDSFNTIIVVIIICHYFYNPILCSTNQKDVEIVCLTMEI